MNEDIRVMNTPTLIDIVEDGSEQGFNRTIEPEWVKQNADPNGVHVASLMVPNHSTSRPLVQHHRAQILMKIKETNAPLIFMLDVNAKKWSWLFTHDQWNLMLEEATKPDPNFTNVCKKFDRMKEANA